MSLNTYKLCIYKLTQFNMSTKRKTQIINTSSDESIENDPFDSTNESTESNDINDDNTSNETANELLVVNSKHDRQKCLACKLIDSGMLKHKCYECGIGPMWQGRMLKLKLECTENCEDDETMIVRLLCPNCYSQAYPPCDKKHK